ncbi:DUF6959 family protein [Micromonospora sp. LH3U1]|uniref:DUF6959 family protein n=1 Tax=Micromonospora sp. LH3U1 TaxID=3018339 RepID=UPI002349C77B|nr:hypothetical protein [Micromonospora sp. LH3U1]WCN83255.1 hypothetical protein PCA76_09475 [Micromonospora sp. LH3U1]
MDDERAQVLAHDGNTAVTHLAGRAFPGIHVQGDTFAEMQRQLAAAASTLRLSEGGGEALDDLDYVVEELTQILRFYEAVLVERGIQLPYPGERSSGPTGEGT